MNFWYFFKNFKKFSEKKIIFNKKKDKGRSQR